MHAWNYKVLTSFGDELNKMEEKFSTINYKSNFFSTLRAIFNTYVENPKLNYNELSCHWKQRSEVLLAKLEVSW